MANQIDCLSIVLKLAVERLGEIGNLLACLERRFCLPETSASKPQLTPEDIANIAPPEHPLARL